jgi:hypothetical protein
MTGSFLDCCPTTDTPASCSAHAGCAGLVGDCCPSKSGQDLYCCYQDTVTHRAREFTFYGHPNPSGRNINYASYQSSTGTHQELRSPDGSSRQYTYTRNGTYQYDMIYYNTNGKIIDANEYVSGKRKFYLTIDSASDAAPCTEILLQLDSLPSAKSDNYPTGRHSRYWGLYTPDAKRIEFTFLDRPDPNVADAAITHIALFFEPGTYATGTYQYSFLDSAVQCDTGGGTVYPPPPVPVPTPVYVPAVYPTNKPVAVTYPTYPTNKPVAYVTSPTNQPVAYLPPPPTNKPVVAVYPVPSPTNKPVVAVYPPPPSPTSYPTKKPIVVAYTPTNSPVKKITSYPTKKPVTQTQVYTPTSPPTYYPTKYPVMSYTGAAPVPVGSMGVVTPGSMAGRQLDGNNEYEAEYVEGYGSAPDDSVAAAAENGNERQLTNHDYVEDQCLPPPVNQCPARHVGVACSGQDYDCQNPECMATPECSGSMVESFLALENRNSEIVGTSAAASAFSVVGSLGFLLLSALLTGVGGGAAFL